MITLFESADLQVIQGDALQFYQNAPTDYVDHIITDPPYSAHVHANIRSLTAGKVTAWTPGFGERTAEDLSTIAEHSTRIARRWCLHFCEIEALGDYARSFGERFVRSYLWRKQSAAPSLHGRYAGNSCEGIAIAHRPGAKRWNGRGTHAWHDADPETTPIATDNVIVSGRNRTRKGHPTQKPVTLCDRLVTDWTDPCETILDSFGGSGAIAWAALRLCRRAIIVERDPLWARQCQLVAENPGADQ